MKLGISHGILSAVEVAAIAEHYDDLELTWVDDDVAISCTVGDICRSHEKQRLENEKLAGDLQVLVLEKDADSLAPRATKVLTKETVAVLRRLTEAIFMPGADAAHKEAGVVTVLDLCDSHEELREAASGKLVNVRHWIDEMQRTIDEQHDAVDREYPDPDCLNDRAHALSNLVLRCEEILAEMRANSPPFGVRAEDAYSTDDDVRKERDYWRQRASERRRECLREHARVVNAEEKKT